MRGSLVQVQVSEHSIDRFKGNSGGDVAPIGRATALQAEGYRFKSDLLQNFLYGPMAKLIDALDLGSSVFGRVSLNLTRPTIICCGVVQLVEHRILIPHVTGSSPVAVTSVFYGRLAESGLLH